MIVRYAKSWADTGAGEEGKCKMAHSEKTYDVNADIWQPNPRRDGMAGENLAIAYVACCVWVSCERVPFG